MMEGTTVTNKKHPEPPPQCDRCGAIITLTGYRATHKDGRELLLCPVHEREHDAALTKQGWMIDRLNPPEPVAGPKTFTQCGTCGKTCSARYVTASPESTEVKVVQCSTCDTRTCGHVSRSMLGAPTKCDSKPLKRDDRACPHGHPLMGADE
jgi:hypothetical protein